MGVRHRELPLEAVQFHPESILSLEGDCGLRLMEETSFSGLGHPRCLLPAPLFKMGALVLERLGLADPAPVPAYWNFLWDSNPPTYCSSRSSSGWPLKSSMEAEADAAAASRFAPTSPPQVNFA